MKAKIRKQSSGRSRCRRASWGWRGGGPALLASLALGVTLTGCGGSSGGAAAGSAAKGPLTVSVFAPFEGSEAFLGPAIETECYAAVTMINDGGGVLGHKMQCSPSDSTSDPADAVPAVTRLLATASNLVLIDGPSDEEPATDPITRPAHILQISWSTQPFYDHQTDPLWYRFYPSDSLAGTAEALYLHNHHYQRVAGVFDTSAGAQTQVPNLIKTYTQLGNKLVINLGVAPGGTYRTEVERLIATHPDAVISELDTPQDSQAFFTELAQLWHGGPFPQMIASSGEVDSTPNWAQMVERAIGPTAARQMVQISTGGSLNTPGYAAFRHALLTAPEKIVDRQQYVNQQYVAQGADGVVIVALAMDEARTTNSVKVAPLMYQIAQGVPGAVTVHTYPDALKAIAAGHRVHYVGGGGLIVMNKYHNIISPFPVLRWQGAAKGWVLLPKDGISPQQLLHYAS